VYLCPKKKPGAAKAANVCQVCRIICRLCKADRLPFDYLTQGGRSPHGYHPVAGKKMAMISRCWAGRMSSLLTKNQHLRFACNKGRKHKPKKGTMGMLAANDQFPLLIYFVYSICMLEQQRVYIFLRRYPCQEYKQHYYAYYLYRPPVQVYSTISKCKGRE
jgi:hypothetical protein